MFHQRDQRGVYILRGMEVIALSGDAYTTEDELYKACRRESRYLTYSVFLEDLHYLLKRRCWSRLQHHAVFLPLPSLRFGL